MQIDPRKLVEARLARALSQEEVAIAADLSGRTIQRIEAGHAASLESTKALLTVFGPEIICDVVETPTEHEPRQTLAASHFWATATRVTASYGFDGLRLTFAAVFFVIAFAKPFMPGHTGLFQHGDDFTIGWLEQPPVNSTEVLGYWIMPLMLLLALVLLFSIGRIRRFALDPQE